LDASAPGQRPALDPEALAKGVLEGKRRALARAITLIESTRGDHRAAANALLQRLTPHAGMSIRLGISGVPGVGKSTFVEALGNHVDLYMTLMFGKSGLSRLEREAIAVVVSAANDCAYCVKHHAEALRRHLDDEETLDLLMSADGLETLEPRLSNIVRHADKLTSAPSAMTESDLGELRAVGLSDSDVLDLTLIVAYFNFVNRIAMGLGVEFSAEEASGYPDA